MRLPAFRSTPKTASDLSPTTLSALVRALARLTWMSRLRVPVSTSLSPDEQRRATVRAMLKQVVSVRWQITAKGEVKTVTLQGKGVKRGRLAFRGPWFAVGDQVRVVVGSKEIWAGKVQVEPRTLLDEARRTGDRLRPALRVVEVAF